MYMYIYSTREQINKKLNAYNTIGTYLNNSYMSIEAYSVVFGIPVVASLSILFNSVFF